MRRLAFLLAVLVLVAVVALPLYVLVTPGGARLLAGLATARLPLGLDGVAGSVLGGLRVQRLRWEEGGTRVSIDDLAVELNLRCAWRSAICLRDVRAAALDVIVTTAAGDGSDDDPLAFLALLPVIEVEHLDLASLRLDIDGSEQAVDHLVLAGRLGPEAIDLETLAACHAQGCLEGRAGVDAGGRWHAAATLSPAEATLAPLTAQGVLLPRRFSLDAEGDLAELTATLAAPEAPMLGVRARLAWAEAAPLSAQAEVRGLAQAVPALAGLPWLQLEGPLRLRLLLDAETLDVTAEQAVTGYAEEALPLRVALLRSAGQWHIDDATLGNPAAPRLRVRGTLGSEADLAPVLSVEAARLRAPDAAGLPVEELSGKAEVAFGLADALTSWSLRTPGLVLREGGRLWQLDGELRAATTTRLPVGAVTGVLRDPALAGGAPLPLAYTRRDDSAVATLRAPEGIALGGLALRRLEVDVREGERLHLALRSEGDLETELAVDVSESDGGIDATLAPFSLVTAGERFSVAEALTLQWQRDTREIRLGAFCVAWQGSRGCSDGVVLGENGDVGLDLRVDETHAGTIGDSPYAIEARGAGTLALSWRAWQLDEAQVDLAFDTLAIDPFVGSKTAVPVRWESSRVTARVTPEASDFAASLVSQQFGRLEAELGLRADDVSGRVRADGLTMAAITDLVPEWSIDDGRIEADLRLAGTRAAPALYGSLRLVDGGARIEAIDTALADLQLEATFEGRDAALSGYATIGGGELRLEGRCCDGERLEGILIGDRNRLRLPVGLDALLSPSLDFALDREQLTVTGSVAVHEGVFEHSGLADGGVAVSPDVERLDAPAAAPRRFRLYLDLRTLIEPGFTLRSKQIESTLGGDLRLVMPANGPPSLFGNLNVLGGELRAYGQALRLTDGALGFVGDPLNPDLAISAEREIRTENQRVGFRVRGTLDEPLFELFSDPPRPDNETLSYLLRGRGPDVGVAADGTAMALSLGASALNQSGVLAPLNAIPGLSGVTLGAEGTDQDMAATISAYVGNRLYLSYGVGIYEPINALTARLYLRSRLWLEVVSRLESSFDLYYRFDRN